MSKAAQRQRLDNKVAIITGAGEKFFCAGSDIRLLASMSPRYKYYFCLHANETVNRLEQTPKLVIAALEGHNTYVNVHTTKNAAGDQPSRRHRQKPATYD